MSGKLIATIYFYVISAASLALIVIGIFNVVNFVINSTQYEKYPLRWGGISSCEGPRPLMPVRVEDATISAKENEEAIRTCFVNEEAERRQHKVEDLKNAITFTLVGVVLFSIHFPLARKQSRV